MSRDRLYRYLLFRHWGFVPETYPVVLFIMLNPSTADALDNDATINRCIAYAKRWKFFRMAVINLFAFRATNPKDLRTAVDPIGPFNMRYIEALGGLDPVMMVCAWGQVPTPFKPHEMRVRQALRNTGRIFHYLRLNQDGETPAHPLYLPAKIEPVRWIP